MPLIILHGLFGMSDNWLNIAKELSQHGFETHLLDLRNHGKSPHSALHTYHEMSVDIQDYLTKSGLEGAAFVGHSMGGKLGMYFTLTQPEKVNRLAVIDIAPSDYTGRDPGFHRNIIHQLSKIDLEKHQRRSGLTEEIQQRLHDGRLAMFLGKSVARDEDGKFFWRLNLPVLAQSLPGILGGFDAIAESAPSAVPTLFVRGEKSDYIQPRYEADRVRFFPASTVETIPGGGHWLHIEQPGRLVDALLRFFRS